ncbi:MAG: fumarylacetoacetate hydrolase family protein [Roseobacter sp.]|jgi:2-keto-4-pentenoate hydratase/2-oxohepta-3-ene-1,7-dioic acid hydratase in catechol pathway|nr:fumarylacetoacetate hydrolase family protein [Roseobacter sp.]
MKWARIKTDEGSVLTGVIEADSFHPRTGLGADTAAGAAIPLSACRLLAPVVPGKFLGLWNNFHASAEKNGWTPPDHPLYFFKSDSSVTGPDTEVTLPASAGRVLFEGELGIVIGKTCKNVSEDQAADAILGYTCVNDFTALALLTQDPAFPQWTRAKSYDGFGVVGPWIETDVDWKDLTIRVLIGERERQSYPAVDMIFSPPQIVSKVSQDMTLTPGDLIACGTSLGARPVKAGDKVTVAIDGIGSVGVTMVAG